MSYSAALDRNRFLRALEQQAQWDILVIGGGATGLGIAVDSAARGFSTLLLEQADFAKGTSSRSTKLVHGGVRYLAQGNVKLVYEALRERGLLLQNAPHLVRKQSFIIPCYSRFSKIKFLIGLKLYDALAGPYGFGKSRSLSREEVMAALPHIATKGLIGGVEYFDGQFDDSRLAINLAQTAAERGGVLLNYCKVTGLLKDKGRICGVQAIDMETKKEYRLRAKTVINATGVFVDDILQMDKPAARPIVRPSQGVHLVFEKHFFESGNAMMIPETTDGRVLFAVPWHDHVIVGTTDTPLHQHSLEPVALESEISFILQTLQQYIKPAPGQMDVKSIFAGLRPLAAPQKDSNTTKEISRDHKLIVSPSGLITITGGKWTTYRKMAEDVVNKAIVIGDLPAANSITKQLWIHGNDSERISQLVKASPSLGKKLLANFSYTEADVVWAVRAEMARTVEDVLARRLRILFLDAAAAIEVAPGVAGLMAQEFGYNKQWEAEQVEAFTRLAQNYLIKANHDYERLPEVSNLSA
jgi:glycerol-3-phosphate dehydrogenase